jgi:hypothetical protein
MSQESKKTIQDAKKRLAKAEKELLDAKRALRKTEIHQARAIQAPKHVKITPAMFQTSGVKNLGALGTYLWTIQQDEKKGKDSLTLIRRGVDIPIGTGPAKSYYLHWDDKKWYVNGNKVSSIDTSLFRVGDVINFGGYRDTLSFYVLPDGSLIQNEGDTLDVPLRVTLYTNNVLQKYKNFVEWDRIGRFTVNENDVCIKKYLPQPKNKRFQIYIKDQKIVEIWAV